MKRDSKEIIKKILKAVRLYRPAVYVYCKEEILYVKSKDLQQFICSPFVNAVFKGSSASDGLPFPPVRLVHLVTNTYRYDWFYRSGEIGARSIREILLGKNLDMNNFESILDFGCGCGRMMRQWKSLKGPKLFGTDYNPLLVAWCREHLDFAEFAVNSASSRLSYEDEKFDFIYAISVFTHLTEELGNFWIRDLARVLKPGGVIYMTTMGAARVAYLRNELQQQFQAGGLVVTDEDNCCSNACAAYHPVSYVRRMLPEGMHVLDFVPGGAKDAHQDAYLLQKCAS